MMRAAPFAPLVAGGASLRRSPETPDALRQRMADVYGVDASCVLPVRDALHGAELVMRCLAIDGCTRIGALESVWCGLARCYRLGVSEGAGGDLGAVFVASPSLEDGRLVDVAALDAGNSLVVVDESLIEFSEGRSLTVQAAHSPRLVVLRSLSFAYGLAGAPCGAVIAHPNVIAKLEEALEPNALATPVVMLALSALDPARAQITAEKVAEVKAERARMVRALNGVGVQARAGEGPFLFAAPTDGEGARAAFRRFGVEATWRADGSVRIDVGRADVNDRVLSALGAAAAPRSRRRAETVRETLETRIVAAVDFDAQGESAIDTGVGFFDHMLAQVATHGGFTLSLTCAGDLEVDAHHSIEDCALALGQALKEALGERLGIARFGFVLPMDEAEAKISIDLGGRPYLVFDGAFTAPLIGAYPTEMTEHVFRSLAQSMGAAIHLSVTGENDHHKTEACFKAFGRALRQAVRIESESVSSTKGLIA